MKTIPEYSDWFPGFINPIDYTRESISLEPASQKLVKHIELTTPYFNELTQGKVTPELRAELAEAVRNYIAAVRAKSSTAKDAFFTLKEVAKRLNKYALKYLRSNFEALSETDRFYYAAKKYFTEMLPGLDEEHITALKEEYFALRLKEISLELTYQLPDFPSADKKAEQALDEINLQYQRFRFFTKILSFVYATPYHKDQFMAKFKQQFLEFCHFLEQNGVELLFQNVGLLEVCEDMLQACLTEMIKIDELRNQVRLLELELDSLVHRQRLKQRNETSLEMLRTRQKIVKQSIASNQQEITTLLRGINLGAQQLYKRIIRLPQQEKFNDIAALFQLAIEDLSKEDAESEISYWGLPMRLFSSFSQMATGMLPSKEAFNCVAAGATAGLVFGPLGVMAGIGAGMAVVAGTRAVSRGFKRLSDIPLDVQQAFYGRFFTRYKSGEFAITPQFKRLCDFNDTKAALVNNFYTQHIFDLELACSLDDAAPALAQIKKQLQRNYQRAREGSITFQQFWETTWREDVAAVLRNYYQEYSEGLSEYLLSLQEAFEVQSKDQKSGNRALIHAPSAMATALVSRSPERPLSALPKGTAQLTPFHDQKVLRSTLSQNYILEGIDQKLDELLLLGQWLAASDIDVRKENSIEEFRMLTRSPLEKSFEDQVNEWARRRSPAHLLMWLQESGYNQVKSNDFYLLFTQSLWAFQGKGFWHIACELSQGEGECKQVVNCLQQPSAGQAGWMEKGVAKIKKMIHPWHFSHFFFPLTLYKGNNPLAYALQINIPLARFYLEQLILDQANISSQQRKDLFSFLDQNRDLQVFYQKLLSSIEVVCPPTTGLMSCFAAKTDYSFELMSALSILVARQEGLPQTANQAQAFLFELQKSPSAYLTLPSIQKLAPEMIVLIARRAFPVLTDSVVIVEVHEEDPVLPAANEPPLLLPAREVALGKRRQIEQGKNPGVQEERKVPKRGKKGGGGT